MKISVQQLKTMKSFILSLCTSKVREPYNEATRKHAPNRQFSEQLIYSEVDFACVHGGRGYLSKSKGKRKMQRFALLVAWSIGSLYTTILKITNVNTVCKQITRC